MTDVHSLPLIEHEYTHKKSEWEAVCLDLGVLELFLSLPAPELANDVTSVALTPQHILVAHKSLQSHRTSGVNPTRADSNLRTKAVPEPIRKSRAGIPERPGGVHSSDEHGSVLLRFCDDRVSVMRGMGVDVFDCGREGGDG